MHRPSHWSRRKTPGGKNIVSLGRQFDDPLPAERARSRPHHVFILLPRHHLHAGRPRRDEPQALRSAQARRHARDRRPFRKIRRRHLGWRIASRRAHCVAKSKRSDSSSSPKAISGAIPRMRATFRSSRRAAKRSTSSCSNIRSQCERAARRLSRLPWSPPSAKDCRRPGMPNPRMCAGSAARALGSGGSGRGAALMALPEASWLRWSNLRPRKAADRPKAVEDAYDRCCGHLPPCCARAASSRFMRSSTSLCS
jgi:hypothetical protein